MKAATLIRAMEKLLPLARTHVVDCWPKTRTAKAQAAALGIVNECDKLVRAAKALGLEE